jgi:hypothetical protein
MHDLLVWPQLACGPQMPSPNSGSIALASTLCVVVTFVPLAALFFCWIWYGRSSFQKWLALSVQC